MKIFKPASYYVSIFDEKLIGPNNEDLLSFVKDFALFGKLGIDRDGDIIHLILNKSPMFVSFPSLNNPEFLKVSDVIKML